jgi:hypothetical protein
MRTTLTLEDDVADRLREESRRSGRSFKETVNEYLRLGLEARRAPRSARRFKIKARPLGVRRGMDYDNVAELLEQIEGPDRP